MSGLPDSLADFGPAASPPSSSRCTWSSGSRWSGTSCTAASRAGCAPTPAPAAPSTAGCWSWSGGWRCWRWSSGCPPRAWTPPRSGCAGRSQWPGPVTGAASSSWCCVFVVVSTRALRGGALLEAAGAGARRPRGGPARRAAGARDAGAAAPDGGGAAAVHRRRRDRRRLRGVALPRLLPRRGRRRRRRAARPGAGAWSRRSRSGWRTPTRGGPASCTTGVLGGVMAALYLQHRVAAPARCCCTPSSTCASCSCPPGCCRPAGRPGDPAVGRRSPTPDDWPEVVALRTRVFVEEQGVPPEIEQDDRDADRGARAQPRRRPGAVVATGRLLLRGRRDGGDRPDGRRRRRCAGRGHGAAVLAELHRQAALRGVDRGRAARAGDAPGASTSGRLHRRRRGVRGGGHRARHDAAVTGLPLTRSARGGCDGSVRV